MHYISRGTWKYYSWTLTCLARDEQKLLSQIPGYHKYIRGIPHTRTKCRAHSKIMTQNGISCTHPSSEHSSAETENVKYWLHTAPQAQDEAALTIFLHANRKNPFSFNSIHGDYDYKSFGLEIGSIYLYRHRKRNEKVNKLHVKMSTCIYYYVPNFSFIWYVFIVFVINFKILTIHWHEKNTHKRSIYYKSKNVDIIALYLADFTRIQTTDGVIVRYLLLFILRLYLEEKNGQTPATFVPYTRCVCQFICRKSTC